MKGWRQIKVGDRLVSLDATGRLRHAVACAVPEDWRDDSGSHATTIRGDFPKAWISHDGREPVPWPVRDGLFWPNDAPGEVEEPPP